MAKRASHAGESATSSRKFGFLKFAAIGLGAFFALILAAVIIIPLVVDVDQYRPQIVASVNQQLNGKLELGKLGLSLWGEVKVTVSGLKLSDSKGRVVVAADEVYFGMPFLSLLTGPELIFRMRAPMISVIKDKSGSLNVLSLYKAPLPSAASAASPTPSAAKTESSAAAVGTQPIALPSIVLAARLGVDIRDASLGYVDKATDLESRVDALNLKIRDISLSKTMHLECSANLDTTMGKLIEVRGPVVMTASATPQLSGQEFKGLTLPFSASADLVQIKLPGLFEKTKSIPANLQGKLAVSLEKGGTLELESLTGRFHNAELKMTATVSDFLPKGLQAAPILYRFKADSNTIDLSKWNALIPPMATYELKGQASLVASGKGSLAAPGYEALLKMDTLSVKAPMVKAQPVFSADVHVLPDRVESMHFDMKAPGNQLRVEGKLQSFTKPNLTVSAISRGMDLDQMIEFPKAKKTAAADKAAEKPAETKKSAGSPEVAAKDAVDYDGMIHKMVQGEMAKSARVTAKMDIAFLQFMGVRMEAMRGNFTLKELIAKIPEFSMKLWGGSIRGDSEVNLAHKTPTYSFSGLVSQLQMKQAVQSQFHLFKDTLLGTADFNIKGTGASLNYKPLLANLKSEGGFKVANTTFTTLNIGPMVSGAIDKIYQSLGGKFPSLKKEKAPKLDDHEGGYELVSADFRIEKGLFSMPNFFAKSRPGQSVDIKGKTQIGLQDYALEAEWEILDPHNVTGLRNVAFEEQGVRVAPLLAKGNEPVRLPMKVTGTLFAPKPNYGTVAEALVTVAAENIGNALKEKAQAELKKRAGEAARQALQHAPKNIQEEAKKALKTFKF